METKTGLCNFQERGGEEEDNCNRNSSIATIYLVDSSPPSPPPLSLSLSDGNDSFPTTGHDCQRARNSSSLIPQRDILIFIQFQRRIENECAQNEKVFDDNDSFAGTLN